MKEICDRTLDLGPFEPKPGDDQIVCRCEEVTQGEIRRAVHDGLFTIAEIRRYLRCGMGLCQGQTCARLVRASSPASWASRPTSWSPRAPAHPCVPSR